jgi:hypothetical protein
VVAFERDGAGTRREMGRYCRRRAWASRAVERGTFMILSSRINLHAGAGFVVDAPTLVAFGKKQVLRFAQNDNTFE